MRRLRRSTLGLCALATTLVGCGSDSGTEPGSREEVVTVVASRDNTLFEENGTLSDGAGQFLFAGTNNVGDARRGLLYFDLAAAAVPAGATVDSARLTLNMSRTQSATGRDVALHRVTASWGEGTSVGGAGEGMGGAATTGDATWTRRFFDGESWTTPGGTFVSSASATTEVEALGSYTWGSTPAMAADVQAWIQDPTRNFGWILVGDESAPRTAKRFDSRSHAAAQGRPSLTVYYRVP